MNHLALDTLVHALPLLLAGAVIVPAFLYVAICGGVEAILWLVGRMCQ